MAPISNCSGTVHFKLDSGINESEEDSRRRFFISYQQHSNQLAEALLKWGRKIKFTSCKYEEGLLDIDFQEPLESMDKGFVRYMKKHLDKEKAYQSISTSVPEIETSHGELCKRIQDIMISDAPISAMPSFQKIILDKIESACPTLKRSKDTYLTQDNIYLPVFVFRVIFDTLYGKESTIALCEKAINNNKSQLWYGNQLLALGQGNDTVIKKLSEVVKELMQDNDIKKRVEEYGDIHKQLVNDERINELKNKIEELWTYVHGGGYLGGFPACHLCDPNKLAPV